MYNLIQGDCLLEMDKLIANGIKVDMVLTDPPYGTTACKWDSIIPFEEMWRRLREIIKNNGAIALFGSEPFSSALRMSNIKRYKYDWVWNKKKGGNPLLAKKQPIKITETISIFALGCCVYYPIMQPRDKAKSRGGNRGRVSETTSNFFSENKEYTHYYPKNIIEFSNANQTNRVHPTQKPVALLEYLIKTYTNEGETVLDFTMGSGSTGVACVNTNRNFIGIELDDKYYNIAKNRLKEAEK